MPHFAPPTSLLETLQSLRYEDALSADDPRYVDTREARGSQQTLNRLAKKLGCDLKQHKFFPPASAHVLFFGHVGSGKTTELRQYARALADSGFIYIVEVDVLSRLDRNNLQYSEVLLAMAEALVERLSADGLATPTATLQPLHDWFSRVVHEHENTLSQEIKAELGAGVSLGVIAKVLAKITASAKTGASYKEQWRQEVRNRFTTLAEHFNTLLRELEAQLSGLRGERLRIAFVIDGADKLRGDDTEQFFVHDAEQLLAIDAFVIYTAPLHLKYSGKLVGKLQDLVLPMIKLYERDGARCEAGWTALRDVLARRIDPALFAAPALMDDLIGYCGGHPRELLRLLGLCCEVADDEVIDRAVLDAAVKLLAADYRRFLSPDDYATLAQLDAQPQHDGNTETIQQLLYKLALLEYNDGSWRRSHPVVRELEGYRNAQQALAQP